MGLHAAPGRRAAPPAGLMLPSESFCQTDRQRASLHLAETLAARFAPGAAAHDRDASFPWENLAELRSHGLLGLTVPDGEGGAGAGVLETVLVLEALARGDGSTALTLGWHLSNIGRLAETGGWEPGQRQAVFRAAVADGALINAALSEVATGSPSRGGRPTTLARPLAGGGWTLDGHKVYVTGAPAMRFFIVTASADDGGGGAPAHFLAPGDTPGLRVEPAWDALGMRASRSDDVILDGARLPEGARVDPRPKPGRSNGAGWGLHVPAVYLGVAEAARDFAVGFAAQRRPSSAAGPIAELPLVQERLARMDLALLPARTLLFTLAGRWDAAQPAERPALEPAVAACKVVALRAALEAVDEAMRVAGAAGLGRDLPLERLYRDVRCGLHNPPMEDVVVGVVARAAVRAQEAGRPG